MKNTANITDSLINDLCVLANASLPAEVVQEAKSCLLDYLGVTLAGVPMLESKTNQLLHVLASPEGSSSLIGMGRTATPEIAALVNGMHAHVAELDDGERFGMFHPGAPIISALLAVAQQKKITGPNFLKGMVIGFEAAIRLAGSLQPGMKDRGYHATGIAGTVGAAVAIGVALNFTKQQLKDALSAAATSASGILKVIKDVSELKPYNVGLAAQRGVIAAFMPLAGFHGPHDALGGELGFLSIMSDNVKLERLSGRPDGQYGIQRVYRKPYAACRHCHPPIEAGLLLMGRHQLDIKSIKSVKVRTYFWAVGGHDHAQIEGVNSAKMSIPYSVAVALVTGKAGLSEFTDAYITDQRVLDLTKKVEVEIDEELSKLVPGQRAAIVDIRMENGAQFAQRIDLPKGEPETALTRDEFVDKFRSLALYGGKNQNNIDRIIEAVDNVDVSLDGLYAIID